MGNLFLGLLIGIYISFGVISFLISGFFVVLGGRERDFWKPFVCLLFPPYIFRMW